MGAGHTVYLRRPAGPVPGARRGDRARSVERWQTPGHPAMMVFVRNRDHLREANGLSGETDRWRLGANPRQRLIPGIMRAMVGVSSSIRVLWLTCHVHLFTF